MAMNIAQILKAKGRAVATVRPDTPLSEIISRLAQKRIGAIIVVGDNGEVAGIISERDIIRRLAEQGEAALKEPVSLSMTSSVVSCQGTSTIDEIMEMMTQGRFRHVPVIEDGSLVGIVSIGDIVKNHIAEVEMEVTAMKGYFATG
jgi:CBS domain-containing protein